MKILVVRLSSIGDIVLTTPVVRTIKTQIEESVIHYLTKPSFAGLLEPNPNINKVHRLHNDFSKTVSELKAERFDLIIDLHNNLRTHRLSLLLSSPYKRVDKENAIKLRMVYLKDRNLQNRHIVDRYLETCKTLGVENDDKGLDFYFPINFQFPEGLLPQSHKQQYICLAIGGQHFTKKLSPDRLIEIAKKLNGPLVVIGGSEDAEIGKQIEQAGRHVVNLAGKTSLMESAHLIKNSHAVITHDTGMMHIATAFSKTVYSIWGNTIPQFGMSPYRASEKSIEFEVENLKCRPCSKIGFDKCPKGHFKCMEEQNFDALFSALNT
jgi:ADP-heptose:LPS heptosyltransferase